MEYKNRADEIGHKLPFIIDLSSHRDVVGLVGEPQRGIAGVKHAIKDCLIYWKQQLNESIFIWLMIGMAEGDGMLAIDAVDELITEGSLESSIKIVPCLLMSQSAFEIDFTPPSPLNQLKALMVRF